MSHVKVGRQTYLSTEVHAEYPEVKKEAKFSTVINSQQQEIPSLPSETYGKKGEVDVEGKAQQARLENQFRRNSIFDAVKKFSSNEDLNEKNIEQLTKILRSLPKNEREKILKEAQKWSPEAQNFLNRAIYSLLTEENQRISQISKLSKAATNIPKIIIDKIR